MKKIETINPFILTALVGIFILIFAPTISYSLMYSDMKYISYMGMLEEIGAHSAVLFIREHWFSLTVSYVLLTFLYVNHKLRIRKNLENMSESQRLHFKVKQLDNWIFVCLSASLFLFIL